jgi:hypothetical protein
MGSIIMNSLAQRKEFRNSISEFHRQLEEVDGVMTGEVMNACNPLKHTFADGLYIREIKFPARELCVTKIHKKRHPFFLLSGKLSILSEHGKVTLEAPHYDITLPGTKRIIWTHTPCVFVTVHATKETDIEKVEDEVIAKDFDDPEINEHDIKLLMEEVV